MTTATRSSGRKRQSAQSGQTRQSGSQTRQTSSQRTQARQSGQSGQASKSAQSGQSGKSARSTAAAQSGKSGQSGQTGRSGQATGQAGSSGSSGHAGKTHEATVELPFVTAQFHAPDVHVPGREDLTSAANSVRSQLPSRDHALFYGALGLSAAFAVIDWPVALAIGVGTALVSRGSAPGASDSE